MASLREVKERIASISSTRKITSAMKMVASAKLHKAQERIENMLPYQQRLNHILTEFLGSDLSIESPFVAIRPIKKVAIVAFSSNNSLAGAFNMNVNKGVFALLKEYESLGKDNILLYPVGSKIAKELKKINCQLAGEYELMAAKPSYDDASQLAAELMELFRKKEIDRVELVYTHFHSMGVQTITRETLLPIPLAQTGDVSPRRSDYIIEPSPEDLLVSLLPKVIRLKMYTALLDSNASEHAARTMAMQIATDNANELIQELTIMYNKTRQQAITNELLDIVGGSMK